MSKERSSRSWSRPRSIDGNERKGKRKSVDLRRSVEERRSRRDDDKDYQRFVLTDPVAFKYLEDDSSVIVLEARKEIQGYQCYIVEQWATSRTNPTFVITTSTGDQSDKIAASILGIPKDEDSWSQRLKVYFAALNHFHARRRDTPNGIIMVTSLPGFPSFLSILPVPDGDVSKHYADFFVNEDLKRLGCAGRVGMSLTPPNSATAAKYYQLYRTSEKVPLYTSVIELVRMCQTALHMFDLLDPEFVDGLLCDVTEKAMSEWWGIIGSEFHMGEPQDGTFGPHSVASLMSVYLGARRRLQFLSVPVPKDSFEVAEMKRGISTFQKSHKLPKTRRLDKPTLLKLHDLTRKVANTDGWHIPVPHLPHAVKTTVAEISGRGEELLAEGHVKKGKAGIRDIESADIDSLPYLVSGQTSKWLWQGKPPKRTAHATSPEVTFDSLFASHKTSKREMLNGGASRKATISGNDRPSIDLTKARKPADSVKSIEEHPARQRNLSHLDSAAKKVHGGVGKVKEAINVHKRSVEDPKTARGAKLSTSGSGVEEGSPLKRPPAPRSYTSPVGSPNSLTPSLTSDRANKTSSPYRTPVDSDVPEESLDRDKAQTKLASGDLNAVLHSTGDGESRPGEHGTARQTRAPKSVDTDSGDADVDPERLASSQLRRRRSASSIPETVAQASYPEGRLARQLSFDVASESMSASFDTPPPPSGGLHSGDPDEQYIQQGFYAQTLRRLRRKIDDLSARESPWTTREIEGLEELVRQAEAAHSSMRDQVEAPTQEAQRIQDMTAAVLRDEQDAVDEGRRELETLAAKLDYEITSLAGKIDEVEVGVNEFERSIELAEGRVNETGRDLHRGGSWNCVVS